MGKERKKKMFLSCMFGNKEGRGKENNRIEQSLVTKLVVT